ncbi:membrane protein implicated in regulation of membrane protease activity [Symbiobacterium terraclitae]|uniref:Membrane protein implicated in regulation of membrane protease activity n=1 Tax=Symbiobacterium terraclitae TaxID=557451 RepID=A0ABS4JR78_9FIRM|nr:hypothetical protein [Symbiobacterium terraclitae]MBP2017496.1 membrane protein implicated in regulation of membrane protease activity [Symbiobacterium terraclitae]
MPPEMGKLAFQIATWIILVAAVLLCFLERGTAERVITEFSLALGLIMAGAVWWLTRGSRRRPEGGWEE